jgi:hypothetical protein
MPYTFNSYLAAIFRKIGFFSKSNLVDLSPYLIYFYPWLTLQKKGLKTKDIALPCPGWAGNINSDGRILNQ